MWHVKSVEVDSGGVAPDIGNPVDGIPESNLGDESNAQNPLRQEEVFERSFDSKPERVIEGLLRTAAEFKDSDIAEHMMHEIPLPEIVENLAEKVIEALKSFAEEQAEVTGDEAWIEVSKMLINYDERILHMALQYITDAL